MKFKILKMFLTLKSGADYSAPPFFRICFYVLRVYYRTPCRKLLSDCLSAFKGVLPNVLSEI